MRSLGKKSSLLSLAAFSKLASPDLSMQIMADIVGKNNGKHGLEVIEQFLHLVVVQASAGFAVFTVDLNELACDVPVFLRGLDEW